MTDDVRIENLADPLVRELARGGQVRSMARNTIFIDEGDKGDSLFVILSGRVKVFVADADGREMVLDFHGPGDYVGEMSLDGRPRSASVISSHSAARASSASRVSQVFRAFGLRGGYMPSNWTNPPNGNSLKPYSVSPRRVDHSVLPKPTKYFGTRTPNSFAGTMWPTSWSATDTINSRNSPARTSRQS